MPIRLLGAQVIKIVMLPDIKERMAVLGFEPVPGESFSKSGRKLPNGQKLSERPFRETAGPSRNSDFMSTRPRWGGGDDREQRSGSLCTKRSVQRCTNSCSRTRVQTGETFEKSRTS
jgi:hypothetical protein